MSEIPTPGEVSGKRHRIFLVDDHPLVREGLVKVIEQEPDLSVCAEAETLSQAYAGIVRLQPDVVVVDLSLGAESGLDLIKQLQTLDRRPRILVLSMHDEVFYAERALRAGALGFVMKRESSSKIIEAIRRVLAGQIHLSEKAALQLAGKLAGVRDQGDGSGVHRLSDRELEIFRRIGQGQETRRIAEDLHLSLKTVQTHCAHIKEKLGLDHATALMREAVRWVENEQRGLPASGPA